MFSGLKSKLITGFQNWKNVERTLIEHEMSKEHVDLTCTFFIKLFYIKKIIGKKL